MLKKMIIGFTALLVSSTLMAQTQPNNKAVNPQTCDDFTNVDIRKLRSKESINLCDYKNKPLLIVNTASNCGFTPQFESLEKLHKTYKDEGLVILGFPSDDFFQEEDNESGKLSSAIDSLGLKPKPAI